MSIGLFGLLRLLDPEDLLVSIDLGKWHDVVGWAEQFAPYKRVHKGFVSCEKSRSEFELICESLQE